MTLVLWCHSIVSWNSCLCSVQVKREFNETVLDRAFLLEEDDTLSKKKQQQTNAFKYGKGAALLQRMGWTGGGLGKDGNEGTF